MTEKEFESVWNPIIKKELLTPWDRGEHLYHPLWFGRSRPKMDLGLWERKIHFQITRLLVCQYLIKDIPVNSLALVHLINMMISFGPVWIHEKWACTCFPPRRNLTYGSLVPLVSLVWVFTNSSAQDWINPSAVYFAGRSWPCLRWTTRWKLENCWAAARSSTLSKVGVVIIVTKKDTMKINT